MTTAELDGTFSALADPTRRAILARLAGGEATVSELAEPFAMSLPAVSKHLKVLERAGLIVRGRNAQWRPCRLAPAPLAEASAWLEQYRQFWEGSFDRLDAHLKRIRKDNVLMTEPTTLPGADGRSITITRVFDAPRELVWQMFTDPEHFRHWFGGGPPMDVPSDRVSMDVRPGGEWAATMVMPNGDELPFAGRYREVVEPERLVFTFENVADRDDPIAEVATVLFEDVGGKTEVSLTQAGYMAPEEYAVGLKDGYGKFFDAIERRLASL